MIHVMEPKFSEYFTGFREKHLGTLEDFTWQMV